MDKKAAWSRQRAKIFAIILGPELRIDWPEAWGKIQRRFPKAIDEQLHEDCQALFNRERQYATEPVV